MALHSAAGCYLLNPGGECSFPSSLSKTRHETMILTALLPFLSFFLVFTGTVGNTDCSHVYTTSGCQIRDTAAAGATYGNAFNAREFLSASFSSFLLLLFSLLSLAHSLIDFLFSSIRLLEGGGVWALLWSAKQTFLFELHRRASPFRLADLSLPFLYFLRIRRDGDGMKIWSFPVSSIPNDIRSRTPNPTTWGTPGGAWAPQSCDPYEYFTKHQLVLGESFSHNYFPPRSHLN